MEKKGLSPIPCNLNDKGINDFAESVAKILKIQSSTNLREVVIDLGGAIHTNNEIKDVYIIVEKEKTMPYFTINIPPYIFPLRERFSIAHELGHLFLHSQLGKYALNAAYDEINESVDMAENQASLFARAFLIPIEEFSKQIKLGETRFVELAAYFQIPLQVMFQRFNDLKKYVSK